MRQRNHRPLVAAVMCASLAAGVSACSSPSGAVPTPDTLSSAQANSILDTSADQAWQLVASRYPGVQRPAVERIRVVSHAEWASAQAKCMSAAGFPQAKAMPDGSLTSGQVPKEQAEPYALAEYSCGVEYPMDAKYKTDFNESQLKWLYRYYTGELTTCMEKHDVSVGNAPSEQKFIDSDGAWSPYQSVDLPQQDYYDLVTDCPEIPDSIYG